jgi:hypothetical protein
VIAALALTLILTGTTPGQSGSYGPPTPGQPGLLPPREPSKPTWALAGTAPSAYEFKTVGYESFVLIAKDVATADDFETAYRGVVIDRLRGKRVRFSLAIRTSRADGGAGLWVRVDDGQGKPLVLKDMQPNLIVGSTPWSTYDIVVDVPQDAAHIGYGIMLVGKGEVNFQNAGVEIVDLAKRD